jgi:hypothetical protein
MKEEFKKDTEILKKNQSEIPEMENSVSERGSQCKSSLIE